MVFSKIDNPGEVLHNCEKAIVKLCEKRKDKLTENQEMVLLMLLYEYIEVKYGEPDGKGGVNLSKAKIGTDSDYSWSIEMLINARDKMCHSYGTDSQCGFWNLVWDDGHVDAVLKHEGFIK